MLLGHYKVIDENFFSHSATKGWWMPRLVDAPSYDLWHTYEMSTEIR